MGFGGGLDGFGWAETHECPATELVIFKFRRSEPVGPRRSTRWTLCVRSDRRSRAHRTEVGFPIHAYRVGRTTRVRKVDEINPPMTTVASGRWTSAPAEVDKAMGITTFLTETVDYQLLFL